MTDTTTERPLPTTRQILDEHYMPPPPVGPVTATRAVADQLHARRHQLVEQVATLEAETVTTLVDDPGATIGVTAITTLRVEADLVGQAEARARTRANSLATSDPDWQGWRRTCEQIHRDWLDARQLVDPDAGDDHGDRLQRSLEGFAARH